MSYSRFGQVITHSVVIPGTTGQVAMIPGPRFGVNIGPGQPYKMELTNQEVESALYGKIQTQAQEQAPPTASPQVVKIMNNGLEVPAYILERAKQREELEKAKQEELANQKAPIFHSVGVFASKNPGVAALAALAAGSVLAHLV